MTDTFDATLYLRHLGRRWRTLLGVPAAAVAVALLLSLALPNKYDATVTLLVQPGASDPRFPPALNQIYLEYLRSYEHVVQGDELVARVLREFHLDGDPYRYNVDSFRRSVLEVQLLKFSKLLTVRVRFDDPKKAHQIALFLAREAVRTMEALREADAERAARQAQQDVQAAQTRLDDAEKKLLAFRLQAREDELLRNVQSDMESKSDYERQLASLQVSIPDLEARMAALGPDGKDASIALSGDRARQAALRRSVAEVERALGRHQGDLIRAQSGGTALERSYQAAREALTLANNRANEARLGAAARTEQLQIADPGIEPQRPSSPHYLFNALLALALGLFAAIVYESWTWNGA
jgi:capsule polysaccharide export protein KpsE/RkpR